MAEFAMVLPMLALLTFGTLEVALYLQQQSAMNAAAFVAARSASVLGGNEAATKASLSEYTDAAGMPWLTGASVSRTGNDRLVGYSLTAGADRLTGLIAGLTSGRVSGFDTLGASAVLPLEYNALKVKTNSSKSIKYKPKTISMIEYVSHENLYASLISGKAMVVVKGVAFIKAIREAMATVVVTPTPGTSPKPKPPGPGGKPTPTPVKTPPPAPPKPDLSDLPKGDHLLSKAHEPFKVSKSVVANPRQRNDEGGDGHNEYFSQGYTGPEYEKSEELKGKVTFKLRNLALELKAYEDNLSGGGTAPTIERATRRTGELLKAGKANPAVKVLIKQATAITGELNKDLEKPLRDVEKLESKTLFKRLRP